MVHRRVKKHDKRTSSNSQEIRDKPLIRKSKQIQTKPDVSSKKLKDPLGEPSLDLAMNIIANHKSSEFIINSDSKSVLQTIQSKDSSTFLITRLLDKMNTLSKNNSIILTWIPWHTGK